MWILTILLFLATLLAPSAADVDAGRELRQQGKIDEAVVFFQNVLAEEPDSNEAQRELGHSLVLAGRYSEAIESYRKLAASEDLRWQLEAAKWTGLAELYLGNVEASLEQSRLEGRLAAQLGESSSAARAARQAGYIYAELARFSEANRAFVDALERSPDDAETLYLAGLLAARQGDWGSLRYQVMDLEPMVARSGNPDRASLVEHLKAELALARGDDGEAIELLSQLSKTTGSRRPLYQETLARAYRQEANLERAEATYRSIVDSTDERLEFPLIYLKALLGAAETLDAQSRGEEAASFYRRFITHWENAAEPLPGLEEARNRLSELEGQP